MYELIASSATGICRLKSERLMDGYYAFYSSSVFPVLQSSVLVKDGGCPSLAVEAEAPSTHPIQAGDTMTKTA